MKVSAMWSVSIKKAGVILGVILLPAIASGAGTISLNVKDTAGVDKFVVTNTGQIGIGVANPEIAIDIKGAAYPFQTVRVQGNTASGGAGFIGLNVPDDGTLPKVNDRFGFFLFGSKSGTTPYHTAGLQAYADGDWTATSMPSSLTFFSTPTNFTGRIERMRISSTGFIGIGTSYPSTKLHVDGSFSVTNGTKNFDIKDPRYNDSRRRLIHSSMEGPEAGVYYRGEAKLSRGTATVTLPPYFEALTRKENKTVLLTAKFEHSNEVLCNVAASEVKNGEFMIRAFGIPDSSVCDHKVFWEVKAERSDVEKLNVEETREDYPEKEWPHKPYKD